MGIGTNDVPMKTLTSKIRTHPAIHSGHPGALNHSSDREATWIDAGCAVVMPTTTRFLQVRTLGWENDDEAQYLLRRVLFQVRPLMDKRDWIIQKIREFFPHDQKLLGVNRNRGQLIFVRLRLPQSPNEFRDYASILATVVHELAHIDHDQHSTAFYDLVRQLRLELSSSNKGLKQPSAHRSRRANERSSSPDHRNKKKNDKKPVTSQPCLCAVPPLATLALSLETVHPSTRLLPPLHPVPIPPLPLLPPLLPPLPPPLEVFDPDVDHLPFYDIPNRWDHADCVPLFRRASFIPPAMDFGPW